MEESKYLKELSDFLDLMEENECQDSNNIFSDLSIKDDFHADYNIKKIKEIQKDIDAAKAYAAESIKSYTEKVSLWLESYIKQPEASKEFMLDLLRDYAKEKLKDSKKKSLKLIEGTIGFKKQQDKFEYNEEELIPFLESNELKDFLNEKVTISVDKRSLKAECSIRDGELYYNDIKLSGVTVTSQEDKFEIK